MASAKFPLLVALALIGFAGESRAVDWSKVLARTEVLSREATEEIGARGMDIVHVAAALSLRCRRFATFDDRQAQLALRAGLEVVAPGRLR